MMEEPSVLDYVKSKLAFWKPSTIEIPPPEAQLVERADGQVGSALSEGEEAMDQPAAAAVRRSGLPSTGSGLLLVLGALVSALVAQSFLEPPNRATTPAVILYGVAAVLIGVAYFRNFALPAALPVDETITDSGVFHKEGLIIGLILMVVAFLLFFTPKGQEVPTFNFLNFSVWVLSILYLAWAFYLPHSHSLRGRLRNLLAEPSWKITLTRWAVLLLVVTGVILFFRFYRLDTMIPEMVSDHAEKLLDVNDVLNGDLRIFFPRNTGREMFQFYWTALMVKLFNTGVSYMALKLGTTLIGLLTLYYMYRLANEISNRWVALFTVLFCGFSYWGILMSRIGLRFPLYSGFYAPLLFHLVRGLRRSNRNDFIWAGIWLGIGLHGYTSYRIVPFVAVACVALYMLHHRSNEQRRFSLTGLVILALISLAVFVPLLRFTLDRPDLVAFRSMTRLSALERPLPGSPVEIFFQNTWNALVMFFWDNGDVWVHSLPHRPAMDVITAALFFLGVALVVLRYVRRRSWVDLFMLLSIPMLLLPSILSLAFPNENPNLNRTSAAYVPAFWLVGIGLEALFSAIKRNLPARLGPIAASALALFLIVISASTNFDLVFNQFDKSMRASSWNTSEMGSVVRAFDHSFGQQQNAWVLAYPYWVDTRLVGINAGYPTRDMAISIEQLATTRGDPRNKLFLINPQDTKGLEELVKLYPEGRYWAYHSRTPSKDFYIFLAPARDNMLPLNAPDVLLVNQPGELP